MDTFKTDFGERIPHANVVFHDGSDPYRVHNTYSVIYNEMVFQLLERRFGKGEAVVFARSGTAGGQRFPVVSVVVSVPSALLTCVGSIGVEIASPRSKRWPKLCVAASV